MTVIFFNHGKCYNDIEKCKARRSIKSVMFSSNRNYQRHSNDTDVRKDYELHKIKLDTFVVVELF